MCFYSQYLRKPGVFFLNNNLFIYFFLKKKKISHQTYKREIFSFGFNKLSIISLFKEILIFHKENIEEAIINSDILTVILVKI